MKKIVSLLLILTLVFALSACGKDKEVKDDKNKTTEQSENAEFKKPEEYATVLFVKINPEFNIYLDAEGNTLAVEPLNDDAKSIAKDFDTAEKDYQKVINMIITSANEKGFVKTDAQISISVVENKSDKVNVDEILSNVNESATQTVTSLDVQVKIETLNAIQTGGDATEPSDVQDVTTSANNDKQTESNKPSHSHSYSQATCTQAQTCSCGATIGSALGHNYDENGVCTRCKAKDPNFRYPALNSMSGEWTAMCETGSELIEVSFCFGLEGDPYSYTCGEQYYISEESLEEDERVGTSITWKNKLYYLRGQGLTMVGTYREENNKIVITDQWSNNKQVVLERTSKNTVKILSVDSGIEDATLPINTVFTFHN